MTFPVNELAAYNYELPPELIARSPATRRDDARLLVVHRAAGTLQHKTIRDLPDLLQPADCLVLNNTRVLPARLRGRRLQTGARWEGLYLNTVADGRWHLLGKTRGHLQPGERIGLIPPSPTAETLHLILEEKSEDGIWLARPDPPLPALAALTRFGSMPLPPYMQRDDVEEIDFERYQTTFGARPGSIAAPTASLHFTPELLEQCTGRGMEQAYVTLHVGIGTFRPITVNRLDEHVMHSEWCEISAETVSQLERRRAAGGRVVAVGTTSTRTLETAAAHGKLQAFSGETSIFIRPPYQFRAIDALLTNFHLPQSTLLVLVCALAERELILEAYREAIAQRYRFFSYGDAMLIL